METCGGAERDRTAGLLVANEALSQLSYSPTTFYSLAVVGSSGKSGADRCSWKQSFAINRG
jgi:hypothetical protein